MVYKNIEDLKKYKKEWRKRESTKIKVSEWRRNNPKKIKKYNKIYKSKTLVILKIKERRKIYVKNLRIRVLDSMGGKCIKCGFKDYRALQIDHINGGGSIERKERKYKGSFHSHVLNSFKKGEGRYQLLCANCNWIKRCENREIINRGF